MKISSYVNTRVYEDNVLLTNATAKRTLRNNFQNAHTKLGKLRYNF